MIVLRKFVPIPLAWSWKRRIAVDAVPIGVLALAEKIEAIHHREIATL
jgi:hypothetical protein